MPSIKKAHVTAKPFNNSPTKTKQTNKDARKIRLQSQIFNRKSNNLFPKAKNLAWSLFASWLWWLGNARGRTCSCYAHRLGYMEKEGAVIRRFTFPELKRYQFFSFPLLHAGAVIFFLLHTVMQKFVSVEFWFLTRRVDHSAAGKLCCGKQSSAFATKFADWRAAQNSICNLICVLV